MDFGRVSLDVIVVEAVEHSKAKNVVVRKILATKGYSLHGRVMRNDWTQRIQGDGQIMRRQQNDRREGGLERCHVMLII